MKEGVIIAIIAKYAVPYGLCVATATRFIGVDEGDHRHKEGITLGEGA